MNKKLWITIGVGVFIFMVIYLISGIIQIGNNLSEIHEYAAYGFYGLSVILAWVLIINPLRIILFSPTYSIDGMKDEKKKYKIYRRVARNLVKSDILTLEEKLALKKSYKNKEKLRQQLIILFNGTLSKEVEKIIAKHSKSVFLATALSQNGKLDGAAVTIANIRMISEIVKTCGFRTSYANLGKLGLRVMAGTLLADGLEGTDLYKLIPGKIGDSIGNIPLAGTVTNSIMQGSANCFLTARAGIATKKYLFEDNKSLKKSDITKASYLEGTIIMQNIVKEEIKNFSTGVKDAALSPFKAVKDKIIK